MASGLRLMLARFDSSHRASISGASCNTLIACCTAVQCAPSANTAARAGSSVLQAYALISPSRTNSSQASRSRAASSGWASEMCSW
ncbi:hypothetical protein SALBM311S_00524 [Streptomyces alboniger]